MGAKEELTLGDGRKVTVDVSTLTLKEWRNFWSITAPDGESDKVLARLCDGLELADFETILRDDYRRIMDKIVSLSNRPLDDPN